MPQFTIKNFDQGINTQDDAEDTRKLVNCTNFDLNNRGKLVGRTGSESVITKTSVVFKRLIRWVHSSLPGGGAWFVFEKSGGSDRVRHYTQTTNPWDTATAVKTLGGAADSDNSRFIPFSHALRIANGQTRKPGIYQYIDRQFFFGGWAPAAGFLYDDATPQYPTTWDHNSLAEFESGANPVGHYYYKFAAVFDGIQECILPDSSVYLNLTNEDKGLKAELQVDTGDFNKRITAIKVYRSFNTINTEPSYTHVKTIPVNTKSTHDDIKSETGVNAGFVLYDPNVDFVTAGVITGDLLTITGNFEIDTVSTHYVTIKTTGANPGPIDVIWDGAYNISTKVVATSGGYGGDDVLFKSTWTWNEDQFLNWVAYCGTEDKLVLANKDKVIHVSSAFGVGTIGTSIAATITNGYRFSISGSAVSIYFYDPGLLDGSFHPLAGIDKIETNYEFGVNLGSRFIALKVALDPDTDNELHDDWGIFSELNQRDILPIKNYMQFNDLQGGAITGGLEISGNLVVFMEKGVFRLSIPQDDPSAWSLEESEQNHGCIAPDSIVKAGNIVIYGGEDNVYVLKSNFEAVPIADDIKDEYQGKSNLQNSQFIHDPLNDRVLCKFGDDVATIYILDLGKLRAGETVWYKYSFSGTYQPTLFGIDENLAIVTINTSADSVINDLVGSTPDEGTITGTIKTGQLAVSDMEYSKVLQELNLSYRSNAVIAPKVYLDRDTTAKTLTDFPINTDGNGALLAGKKRIYSIRIGRWASYVQLELSGAGSFTELEKIELNTG